MSHKYKRLNPKVRKGEILAAAIKLAESETYCHVSRQQIAEVAGTSPPLITRYFKNMDELRDAVMREAIRIPALHVIAQGLAGGCPIAKAAPEQVRLDALASIK